MIKDLDASFVALEMREAHLGSFPLSPGVMGGHQAVADLYWNYRRGQFEHKAVEDIFGTRQPEPPRLVVPPGHREINPIKLNQQVWDIFLETSFSDRPRVTVTDKIRELIDINAGSDRMNFEKRLEGQKSRIVGNFVPSLLRSFVFENKFPYKNEFFSWLIPEMAKEIKKAAKNDFREAWTGGLQALVLLWNGSFPSNPFVPGR